MRCGGVPYLDAHAHCHDNGSIYVSGEMVLAYSGSRCSRMYGLDGWEMIHHIPAYVEDSRIRARYCTRGIDKACGIARPSATGM